MSSPQIDHDLAILLLLDIYAKFSKDHEEVARAVFFRSSSPMARSGFMRSGSTVILP
jgi:hypothetical protein